MRNLFLLILALGVAVGAWQVARHKAPTTEIVSADFLPGFLAKVNDTTSIEVKSKDGTLVVARQGEHWVAKSYDDYPAKSDTVKQALVQLASLKIIEAKTSKPEKYAQLGVEDVTGSTTSGRLVTLKTKDATQASVIIGKQHAAKTAGAPRYYVRRAGEASATLVEGELTFSGKANDWVDTAVVDLPVERVHQVTVVPQGESPIVVSKASPEVQLYDLAQVPAGFEVKAHATVSSIGGILLDVKFERVIAARKLAGLTPRAVATVETFDGLTATIERYEFNSAAYLTFKFAHTPEKAVAIKPPTPATKDSPSPPPSALKKPEEVAQEVTSLNTKLNAWAYGLPEYKSRLLDKKLAELITKKAPPTKASGEVKK